MKVFALDTTKQVAVITGGKEVPITEWINASGACDPHDATVAIMVVGEDEYLIDMSAFQLAKPNFMPGDC